jgi:hypothetical protein
MHGAFNLGGGGRAALLLIIMGTFSYGPAASPPTLNPPIDFPRGMIADTVEFNAAGQSVYIFSDQEILMFTQIQQSVFQSLQFFSPPAGSTIQGSPPNYFRLAAMLLRAMAANQAKLAAVQQLLDVKLDASKAAAALNTQADAWEEMDDNSGAVMIVEWCNDYFSYRDRFWKQVQRQSGV